MAFASNFKVSDNGFPVPTPLSGGSNQDLASTSATQNYPLLTRVKAVDPCLGQAEFVYCKGVASTAVGEAIQINPDGTTTRSATPKGVIGVAMSANVASQYGWYCIKGRCIAKIAADYTAGPAYMSATAGTIQSTVIAGSHIVGMVGATALDAGGSAVLGSSDTTAAHTAMVLLMEPYCIAAV